MRIFILAILLTSCNGYENGDKGIDIVYSECLHTESNLSTGVDFKGNVSMVTNNVCINKMEISVEYTYQNNIKHLNAVKVINNGVATNTINIE